MPHRLRPPPLWRTLRFRVGAAALLLVSAVFAGVALNTLRVLEQASVAHGRAVSRQIAQVLNLALAPHAADDRALLRLTPYLQELVSPDTDGLVYLVVQAESGQDLVRTDAAPQPLPPPDDDDPAPAWRRGVLHLSQPILLGDQQVGRLRYGLSSRPLHTAAEQLFRQHLLLYAGALLLLGGPALWGMQRLSRRVDTLVQAGGRLAAGDYGATVPTPGRDELTLLGHEFNLMAEAVRSRIQALEHSQADVRRLNEDLERRVERRTAELREANLRLAETLDNLRRLQDGLVQQEKLASLGSLVAAVAHELNTPIGNALTVATAFSEKVGEFDRLARDRLHRQTLVQFLTDSRDAATLVERNLARASALITSFKQVAVDQTSSQRRRFDLAETLADVLATLSPALRRRRVRLVTDLAPGLQMLSYPGPLGQVLSNLHNNALLHGFGPDQAGVMRVRAQADGDDAVLIEFSDDGQGMAADTLHRVFDPFFTTRLGQGGNGLGMHIVHNIVVGLLQGRIDIASAPGQGCQVRLHLPRTCGPAEGEGPATADGPDPAARWPIAPPPGGRLPIDPQLPRAT